MPFAATWMDLDIMMLSEVSQKKTNTFHHFTKGKMDKSFVSTGDKRDSLGEVLLGSKAPTTLRCYTGHAELFPSSLITWMNMELWVGGGWSRRNSGGCWPTEVGILVSGAPLCVNLGE